MMMLFFFLLKTHNSHYVVFLFSEESLRETVSNETFLSFIITEIKQYYISLNLTIK